MRPSNLYIYVSGICPTQLLLMLPIEQDFKITFLDHMIAYVNETKCFFSFL